MSDTNLLEAFASYKVKLAKRARSAVAADGSLIVSCWYTRFHKAEGDVLRYEENLSADTGSSATSLRAHLADALEKETDIRLIVATAPAVKPETAADANAEVRAKPTTFHVRRDLLGRVTVFDGQRFIIEFRKHAPVVDVPQAQKKRA